LLNPGSSPPPGRDTKFPSGPHPWRLCGPPDSVCRFPRPKKAFNCYHQGRLLCSRALLSSRGDPLTWLLPALAELPESDLQSFLLSLFLASLFVADWLRNPHDDGQSYLLGFRLRHSRFCHDLQPDHANQLPHPQHTFFLRLERCAGHRPTVVTPTIRPANSPLFVHRPQAFGTLFHFSAEASRFWAKIRIVLTPRISPIGGHPPFVGL